LLITLKGSFLAFALLGVSLLLLYWQLPAEATVTGVRPPGLDRSRRKVSGLAAIFALDSFGGGFAIQSIVALWLFNRFGASLASVATIFFVTGLASSVSLLLAPWLARRIGLMNSMVFTHVPANLALLLVPFMPTLESAIAMLLLRSMLSQMDVPARMSYIMAVVDPHERAAAVSIISVVRSVAGAGGPIIAGSLLTASSFGWPLLISGGLKLAYDAIFVRVFRKVPLLEST
jgi:predicted MFS family arabinose efflux permease